MPDPQTTNLQLYVPLNGADVGVWDVPNNANFNQLDNIFGATVNVALTNVPVTLSGAQYNASLINFTGTLTGDVNVTFPAYGRRYILSNNCAANTSFLVRAWISSAAQYVALPPNEVVGVIADGTNIKFMGLDRIGTYWDFAGSAVPIWVTGSNPQPYLNCDGTAFSSATYPALRDYLGGTTLPDARGRFRAALNQATGRLTGAAATGGVDGNTLLAAGGTQSLSSTNLPNYTLSTNDPGHSHNFGTTVGGTTGGAGVAAGSDFTVLISNLSFITGTQNAVTNVATSLGGAAASFAPPSYVGGLTLIRAG